MTGQEPGQLRINMAVQNIVLPGQYFDQETSLHYNYFRDYDPSTGRYIESDPIGLQGGINTYTYTAQNPIKEIDPLGLLGNCGMPGGSCGPNSPYWHKYRNRYNKCPACEPVYGLDCKNNWWNRDNVADEYVFHGGYKSYRRTDPDTDGSFQCVYDNNGLLVTKGPYRGTYDYLRPSFSSIGHTKIDIIPHIGASNYNDPDDTYIYCDQSCCKL